MAQIMKYHEHPSSYDWNLMPNWPGNDAISALMLDIGNAVSMSYTCSGLGANTQTQVANAFKNNFGYQNAQYADYGTHNYQLVQQEIDADRPVALRGGRNAGWWIFGVYADGHA